MIQMDKLSLSIEQLLGISSTISVFITISICALWTILLNRIKQGQRAEFEKQIEECKSNYNKEIENLKTRNEKLNYITKTQFEAEFKMYQELSDYSFQMLLDTSQLFPIYDQLPEDKDEQQKIFKQRYDNAVKSFVLFQNTLQKHAPFISKELYNIFEHFRQENKLQVNMYPNVKFETDSDLLAQYMNMISENYKRTYELSKMHDKIIEDLRAYLNSLKVIEQ